MNKKNVKFSILDFFPPAIFVIIIYFYSVLIIFVETSYFQFLFENNLSSNTVHQNSLQEYKKNPADKTIFRVKSFDNVSNVVLLLCTASNLCSLIFYSFVLQIRFFRFINVRRLRR